MRHKRIIWAALAVVTFSATLAVVTSINLDRDTGALSNRDPEIKKQVMIQAERASVVPSRLGSIDLLRRSEGPEAIDRFARLTGRHEQLSDAVFAEYEGPDGRARLWVGWMADSSSAKRTVFEIRKDIETEHTPFTRLQEGIFDDTSVFEFSGLSQKQAYFASGNKVVWFSADMNVYQSALLQILDRLSR